MRVRRILHTLIVLLVTTSPAFAQRPRPISPFVLDIRAFSTKLKQDPETATDLKIEPTSLPARGIGGVAGIHVYPIRGERIALGFGGEGVLIRGNGAID